MRRRRWIAWIVGMLIVLGLLGWLLHGFDYQRFRTALAATHWPFDVVLLAAVLLEQLLRAWKWRLAMRPVGSVPTLRLFGATLASYLPGLVMGMGVALVARAWLVARRSSLQTAAVLATAIVDRLIDGLAFLLVVVLTLGVAAIPVHSGKFRTGLIAGARISTLFIALGITLVIWHRRHALGRMLPFAWMHRLPQSLAKRVQNLSRAFAEGTIWPAEPGRALAIGIAAMGIKALVISDMLWATLAVGMLLRFTDYLLIMVFLSSVTVAGFFVRLPGGMLLASAFVLNLLGVAKESALLAAVMMEGVFLLTYATFGAAALLIYGVRPSELVRLSGKADGPVREGNAQPPGINKG
ncbi:MAG: lysylphosphatidylglycerol synthase transmembrane domain-containing protein [Gammaproteobacteria bacterium]